MKVFLSWSGPTSKAVAETLREWLPYVIQDAEPWMSASDIEPGARWNTEIGQQLQSTGVGILCLTPNNSDAPWLLFEAGALSKALDSSRVIPYLFRLEPTDLKGPLVQFQASKADKVGTKRIVQTINHAIEKNDKPLADPQLDKVFDKWWPDLEAILSNVSQESGQRTTPRSERDILEEILDSQRAQKRAEEERLELQRVQTKAEQERLAQLSANNKILQEQMQQQVELLREQYQKTFSELGEKRSALLQSMTLPASTPNRRLPSSKKRR